MTIPIKIVFTALALFSISFSISAQDELRILPLGNSLTKGFIDLGTGDQDQIGYRYQLYNLLNAAGYNYSFVGHRWDGWNILPSDYAKHGGIKGIRSFQLASVMTDGYYWDPNKFQNVNIVNPNGPYLEVEENAADVILLHIGSNDVYKDESTDASAVGDILDAVDAYETANSTEVLVIVSQIISTRTITESCTNNWRITEYNDNLETLVNARISAGDKLKLISMQCLPSFNYWDDMQDDQHPKQPGYNLMGAKWFEAIDEIHDSPLISPITVASINEGSSFATINLDNYVSDDLTSDEDMEWELVSGSSQLDVTINPNRTLDVNPVDSEWNGSETITLKATDKGAIIEKLHKSATIDISFTVNPVNDAPEILNQITSFNRQEDQSFTISMSDLELMDIDNSVGELTLNIKPGENYTVAGNTITPLPYYNGNLEVIVTVSDPEPLESNAFLVQAYFSPVDNAPEITGSVPIIINQSDTIEITIAHLLVEDHDNTAEQLALQVLGGSNYTLAGTNKIHPYTGFDDTLYVNLRVHDPLPGLLQSEIYQLPIDVVFINLAPEFDKDIPDTTIDLGTTFNVSVKATDQNEHTITYSALFDAEFLNFYPSTRQLYGRPEGDQYGEFPIVIIASDGYDDDSMKFVLTVRGPEAINTHELSNSIQLYPNPANSEVSISFDNSSDINRMSVIDIFGRIILEQEINTTNSNSTFNVSDLEDGSYILYLHSENNTIYKKFVVCHSQ